MNIHFLSVKGIILPVLIWLIGYAFSGIEREAALMAIGVFLINVSSMVLVNISINQKIKYNNKDFSSGGNELYQIIRFTFSCFVLGFLALMGVFSKFFNKIAFDFYITVFLMILFTLCVTIFSSGYEKKTQNKNTLKSFLNNTGGKIYYTFNNAFKVSEERPFYLVLISVVSLLILIAIWVYYKFF